MRKRCDGSYRHSRKAVHDAIPAGVKVHLALGYTDLRKGIDGLGAQHRSLPGTGSHRTRRWRRQSRANPSLNPKFPVMQGKYREFHRFKPRSPKFGVETAIIISALGA